MTALPLQRLQVGRSDRREEALGLDVSAEDGRQLDRDDVLQGLLARVSAHLLDLVAQQLAAEVR